MDSPKMAMDAGGGGGLLNGLRKKKPDQRNGGGFLMTADDRKVADAGGTPGGFVRDKDGNLQPLVYGGR